MNDRQRIERVANQAKSDTSPSSEVENETAEPEESYSLPNYHQVKNNFNTLSPNHIQALQRTVGNQAVTRLIEQSRNKPIARRSSVQKPSLPGAVIQRAPLLIEPQSFTQQVGPAPKKLVGQYNDLLGILAKYHNAINKFKQIDLKNGFRSENRSIELKEKLQPIVEELVPVATEFKEAIDRLYEKEKPLIGKGSKTFQRLGVLKEVVAEIVRKATHPKLLSGESSQYIADFVELIKQRGRENTLNFIENNPDKILNQEDLDQNSVQTNVAKGAVNQVGIGTYNPRPNGPIETPLTGYTKTGLGQDGKESVSDDAYASGIHREDPRSALRAVAAYKVSELIGLGIIPRTALTKFTDQEGNQRLGQVMEKVSGSAGLSKDYADISQLVTDPEKKAEIMQALAVLKNPQADPEALKAAKEKVVGKFTEIGGEIYKNAAEDTVTKFDWSNPIIERDLSTLQIFDLIIGHVDRHAGNYIVDYDPNDKNKVFGVKGIDNDDVMGRRFINVEDTSFKGQGMGGRGDMSKTPGLPPVIDFTVAVKLLSTNWENIEAELQTYTMSEHEIAAAKLRWDRVIEHVISLVRNNGLANLEGVPDVQQIQLLKLLMNKHGYLWSPKNLQLRQWGTESTTSLLTSNNSYSGKQRAKVEETSWTVLNEPQYRA